MKKALRKFHIVDRYGSVQMWICITGVLLGFATLFISAVAGLVIGITFLDRHFQRQECRNFSKAMDLETRARVLTTLGDATCFVRTPAGVWINKDNYSANEVNLGGK